MIRPALSFAGEGHAYDVSPCACHALRHSVQKMWPHSVICVGSLGTSRHTIQQSSSDEPSGSRGGSFFNPPFAAHSSWEGRGLSGDGGVRRTSQGLKWCSCLRYRYSMHVMEAVTLVIGRNGVRAIQVAASDVRKISGLRIIGPVISGIV